MSITFQDVLPDPNYRVGNAGESTSGSYGPGFKSIKLTSQTNIAKNRTNSGRLISRSNGLHNWNIQISYNPMTREEFEPVYNFLLSRQLSLKPFYVSLPHLRDPQDSLFKTYVEAGNAISAKADTASGSTEIMLDGFSGSSGDPRPGDLFHIRDSSQVSHLKSYQVVQVQTSVINESPSPVDATERKVVFIPALTKKVFENATIHFHNPLIRVIMKSDMQEYSLNTEGLYQFNLRLEEAQV